MLYKPILAIYKNVAFMEHQLFHVINANHIVLQQVFRTHYPLPFNDQLQLEILTDCRKMYVDPEKMGIKLTIKHRLTFLQEKETKEFKKETREELESIYNDVVNNDKDPASLLANGLEKWFTKYPKLEEINKEVGVSSK